MKLLRTIFKQMYNTYWNMKPRPRKASVRLGTGSSCQARLARPEHNRNSVMSPMMYINKALIKAFVARICVGTNGQSALNGFAWSVRLRYKGHNRSPNSASSASMGSLTQK